MGLLSRLVGNRGNNSHESGNYTIPQSSGNALSSSIVLRATSDTAVTPDQAKFNTLLLASVPDTPTLFSKEEANQLSQTCRQVKQAMPHVRKAYRSIRGLLKSEGELHHEHRKTQQVAAKVELGKIRDNYGLAKTLHGQRPAYALMGNGLGLAEEKAEMKISQVKQQQQISFERFKQRLQSSAR